MLFRGHAASSLSSLFCSLRFASTTTASEKFVGGTESTTDVGSNETSSSPSSAWTKSSRPLINADFQTTCPFQCLGLTRTASKEQVREHFLQLAKVHHPDVGGDEWKFKRVNAAYKQSIEMIETGYAAKTAGTKREADERDRGESRQAPHEEKTKTKTQTNRNEGGNDQETSRPSSSSSSSSSRPSTSHYYSSKRTSNFSSANCYASAERAHFSSSSSSTAKKNQSSYYNEFVSSSSSSSQTKNEGGESVRECENYVNGHRRDDRAKAHNRNQDWFRETYESSWSKNGKANESERHRQKPKCREENEDNGEAKSSAKKQHPSSSSNNTNNNSDNNPKTGERDFGSDENWFEFRENFFRDRSDSLTPRDLYRFRFSRATTVKEIDECYNQAMAENIFSGFDIGEPLHLALERYHLELGLGEKHLEKCFQMIDDWEGRTKSRASCVYYQCILKIYTNERMLALFPNVDASTAAEVVWKVLQKMQDNDVSDDSGIAWWNVLANALLNREPHG